MLCAARRIWVQAVTVGASSARVEHEVEPGAGGEILLQLDPNRGCTLELAAQPPAMLVDANFWSAARVTALGHEGWPTVMALSKPTEAERHGGRAQTGALYVLSDAGRWRLEHLTAAGERRVRELDLPPGRTKIVLPLD